MPHFIDFDDLAATLAAGTIPEDQIVINGTSDVSERDVALAEAHSTFDMIATAYGTPEARAFLRDAILNGRIKGDSYWGECRCFVGTLFQALDTEVQCVPTFMEHENDYGIYPIERLFLYVNTGDIPATNPVLALAIQWLDALPPKPAE